MLNTEMPGKLNKVRQGLIVELRNKRLWSQEQLAEVSGISVRTIQRLEAGSPANFETLQALAQAFDLDTEKLIEPNTNSNKSKSTPKVHILSRLTTGTELCDVVGGAHMQQIGHDEINTQQELEACKIISQHIQDIGNIWNDVQTAEQLQIAFDTTAIIEDLKNKGFAIFGKRRRVMLSTADGKLKTPMIMATFRIAKLDSAEIVTHSDGKQYIPFVDFNAGKPFNF